MKKTLFYLFALTCIALGLTACGDDEPDTKVTAQAEYQIDFSDDLTEVANVGIVYVTNDGQVTMDRLADGATRWTHTASVELSKNRKAVDFGYKVVLTYKGGELTKDSYELKAEGKITASVPSSHRTISGTLFSTTAGGNRLQTAITNSSNKALGVTVDRNGNINQNSTFTVSI